MSSSNNDNLYNARLFCYQIRKKKRGKQSRLCVYVTVPLIIVLVWLISNERNAWKLIWEQECINKASNNTPESRLVGDNNPSSCLSRVWERYTHRLSEKDAALIHVDIQSSCTNTIRLGNWLQDGGWNICGDDFQPSTSIIPTPASSDIAYPCVVYSFGINDDPSFDRDLVTRWPSCTVYAFDPSIGRKTGDTYLGPNIKFYSIGLGGGSSSINGEKGVNEMNHTYYNKNGWKMMTLDSIMSMLNHNHVNLIKMDIEGSEWETFQSWEKTHVHKKIGQLVGEIHLSNNNVDEMINQVHILQRLHNTFGFQVFHRQDNFRYSRLVNLHYSKNKMKSIRTYRCLELGWRRNESLVNQQLD